MSKLISFEIAAVECAWPSERPCVTWYARQRVAAAAVDGDAADVTAAMIAFFVAVDDEINNSLRQDPPEFKSII